MDEMTMPTAAPAMATVIIGPENLSRMTVSLLSCRVLLQPIPFSARKNLWRCRFVPRSSEASSSVARPGGGHGGETMATIQQAI
jgi:hypothetical protein